MTTRQGWWSLLATVVLGAAVYAVGLSAVGDYPPQPAGLPPAADTSASEDASTSAFDHLTALAKIAAEHDGNRASGTEGYAAAADYVEEHLQSQGWQTERQYFAFTFVDIVADSLQQLSPTTREIEHEPMGASPSTPNDGVAGEVRTPTTATGCSAAAYAGAEVAGSIVLVQRGDCSFGDKSQAAAEAGAVAAVIYNNEDGPLGGTLGDGDGPFVPTMAMTQDDGEAVLAQLASEPITWHMTFERIEEERETFNLIAQTTGGRSDNVVMAGAHLDSVPSGPGINDNGSGVAALLEVAADITRAGTPANQVRLAFWGAEELGLIGSTHYVTELAASDPSALSAIAVYLNIDMVASPNYVISVYDGDQSTYPAELPLPPGSDAAEAVLTGHFDQIGQPWVDTAMDGRSDYQAFIEKGIPAAGIFTGADGTKSAAEVELFGGTEGAAYDANYHTPDDDLDNLDTEALQICLDAIEHGLLSYAADTSAINGR